MPALPNNYSQIFITFLKDWSKRFISEFSDMPLSSLPNEAKMFPIAIFDVMLNGIQQGPESLDPNTIMIDTHRWFEQSGTQEQYKTFGLYHDGMIDVIKKQYENRDEMFNGYPEPAGDYMTPEEGLFLLTVCVAANSAIDYFGKKQLPYVIDIDSLNQLYQFLCRALYDFRYETSKEQNRLATEILNNAKEGHYVTSQNTNTFEQHTAPQHPQKKNSVPGWLWVLLVGVIIWFITMIQK